VKNQLSPIKDKKAYEYVQARKDLELISFFLSLKTFSRHYIFVENCSVIARLSLGLLLPHASSSRHYAIPRCTPRVISLFLLLYSFSCSSSDLPFFIVAPAYKSPDYTPATRPGCS
jgi:hypothetical protein